MTSLAIRSRRIVAPDGIHDGVLCVDGSKIAALYDLGDAGWRSADRVVDATHLVVMPGLVDTHVHINEPGRTDWEGFECATAAAAAGGITTVVDMPLNSTPVSTSADSLTKKLHAAAKKLRVDCGFHGGVVPGNESELLPMARMGVLGFKAFLAPSGLEEFPEVTERDLLKALPLIKQTERTLHVHCELLSGPAPRLLPGTQSYFSYLRSRPESMELEAIELVIKLCRKFRTPIHIVHVSAASALRMIADARIAGVPISAETCPHYLAFSSADICPGDTRFKCTPPIRGRRNRDKLWAGLKRGDLDMICSDHSPCPTNMKHSSGGDFYSDWGGITSLQLTLPAVWTEARNRDVDFMQLTNWLSETPARIAGLSGQKGSIAPGNPADIVIWDPESSFTVRESKLQHRQKHTAYAGRKLYGKVVRTFVRGQEVFHNGKLLGVPMGSVMFAPQTDGQALSTHSRKRRNR